MAVSIRLFSFVLVVFTLGLIIGESAAHGKVTIPKRKLGAVVHYDAVPTAAEEVIDENPPSLIHHGSIIRKMLMLKWASKRSVLTVDQGLKGEDDDENTSATKSSTSGADHDHHPIPSSHRSRKGTLNVNSKLITRNRNHGGRRRRGKSKMGGFAAFSADYHVPRSHPPKNN